ncbi:D-hexose-6-phosphate mutarotase [uncultured Ramlibacter sp.]|mgnify:CR=1 FL=1|uniref:D-hexose-6-phosphate mutarotase n=1 Tax=uncultured Ramlibacter sp. TaxID=260755 RepID=UPI0026326714|nr:D-hexose-6-phosphate mutarotase [uncultured Ramlibacter sp.]
MAEQVLFQGQPALRLAIGPQDAILVALHGGHLLSWTARGQERLYLSPKAIFDGQAAIRGGVPVCLPQFNERGPLGARAKHGFVRNLAWATVAGPAGQLVLQLADSEATRALWPHAFRCELRFILGAGSLRIELLAHNTGEAAFAMTGALHSYFAVEAIETARLRGLDGALCLDTVAGHAGRQSGDVLFGTEVDNVYDAVPGALELQGGASPLRLSQSPSWGHTVVWNPGPVKGPALADLPADGWRRFVCVEAAQVLSPVQVPSGAHWQGWQQFDLLA